MSAPPQKRREPRPQAVLTVTRAERLSPHMVRVVAGGTGMVNFRDNNFADKYAKFFFVDPALNLDPPYDLEALNQTLPPSQRPVSRTYTVRRVDPTLSEIWVDFVVHGEQGLAGPWAAQAAVGDVVALSGAGGGYSPTPDCDWHLFLGDESALPAICSALEVLPPEAEGVAYLETQEGSEHITPRAPAGVEIVWLHRPEPGTRPELLGEAVDSCTWRPGRVGVFAHGERESMKVARAALKPHDDSIAQISISGYWAHGRTEDRFQAEKREPVGQIA